MHDRAPVCWLYSIALDTYLWKQMMQMNRKLIHIWYNVDKKHLLFTKRKGERGGSVVECRTREREVRGSRPTSAVLCPWARHFTPRKYWLITQEAMAPSRHDWKIVDWDVKPQHNQPTNKEEMSQVFVVIYGIPLFSQKKIDLRMLNSV